MLFASTEGQSPPVSYAEAIAGRCIAPDGGLYYPNPRDIEPFSEWEIEALRGNPLTEVAYAVLQRLIGGHGMKDEHVRRIATNAFTYPIPTMHLKDNLFLCERFHGPTGAFKDDGAAMMRESYSGDDVQFWTSSDTTVIKIGDTYLVITVTSGDTGGAVVRAFHNKPGVTLVTLFPKDGVSPFQAYQMQCRDNIYSIAMPTSFSHNQKLQNKALVDPRLSHLKLGTGNSKNLARLLAQVVPFFVAYLDATTKPGQKTVFSVPCGNFGNIAAGRIAQIMGLPIRFFVAATNVNSPFPDFLETGKMIARNYNTTLSNSMDVHEEASNHSRLVALHDNDLLSLRANIKSVEVADADVADTIRWAYRIDGRVMEPHTAAAHFGQLSAQGEVSKDEPIIAMATASPAKFGSVLKNIIGITPDLPPEDANWTRWEPRFIQAKTGSYEELMQFLLNLSEKEVGWMPETSPIFA